MGNLHGVPELPPHYLPREADLAGLKHEITRRGCQRGHYGTILGSSVFRAWVASARPCWRPALARDSEVRQAFPDGICWITIGQEPNLLALQNQLLRQLTGSKETLTTEHEAKDAEF